jgi:hypothetical protein
MMQSEEFSDLLNADQIRLAEHELSAFVAAVTELFGPEQARLGAEDWLAEAALMATPRSTNRNWRTVTIAASDWFANRVRCAPTPPISLGTTADTKVSSIPSSNCLPSTILI